MPPRKQPETAPPERDVSGPRSLTRLLGLFGVLSQATNGMTLAELSVSLESPKSSLLNLLRPLVRARTSSGPRSTGCRPA